MPRNRWLCGVLVAFFGFAGAQTVVVRPGDTLSEIALRYDTTVAELRAANPQLRGDLIRAGDELMLPSEARAYRLEPGDSLEAIAAHFGVTLQALMAANGLESTTLNPGTVLRLPEPEERTYTVAEGDSLYEIALIFDTTVEQLLALNDIDGDVIHPGQVLRVSGAPAAAPTPAPMPLVVTVKPGDTLWEIAHTYDLTVAALAAANNLSADSVLQVGARLTIPGRSLRGSPNVGGNAAQEVIVAPGDTLSEIALRYGTTVAALQSANNLSGSRIFAGQRLRIIPGSELVRAVALPAASSAGLLWPLPGAITSRFGYRQLRLHGSNFHNGIDIDGVTGEPVVAAAGGVVSYAGWRGGYGLLVVITDGEREYRYGHNSELLVSTGQRVAAGEVISRVGNTGLSFGDHLHFEVRIGGSPIDPLTLLEPR